MKLPAKIIKYKDGSEILVIAEDYLHLILFILIYQLPTELFGASWILGIYKLHNVTMILMGRIVYLLKYNCIADCYILILYGDSFLYKIGAKK